VGDARPARPGDPLFLVTRCKLLRRDLVPTTLLPPKISTVPKLPPLIQSTRGDKRMLGTEDAVVSLLQNCPQVSYSAFLMDSRHCRAYTYPVCASISGLRSRVAQPRYLHKRNAQRSVLRAADLLT
jgi:hypothetical protein